MHFTSEQHLDDAVIEREFVLDDIPGILWTPSSASGSAPAPLVLLGHPGGMTRLKPRLAARSADTARHGFAAATIELPGSGDRPAVAELDEARADLRAALAAGEPVDGIVERLIPPLVDAAVPEWQRTLDSLLALPELEARSASPVA